MSEHTKQSKYSKYLTDAISNVTFTSRFATTLLLVVIVGGSYYLGSVNTELRLVRSGNTVPTKATGNAAPTPTAGTAPQEPTPSQEEMAKVLRPIDRDHKIGAENPKIALIEYSDFQCPFCARFHPTAQQVIDTYGDDVVWIYRHFPLTTIHPDANPLALASECVYEQGGDPKFWEFADKVFADGVTSADLSTFIPETLGLDLAAFNDCYNNKKPQEIITSDMTAGTSIGVSGTPGNFIINLETNEVVPLRGAVPFETVDQAIQQML